MMLDASDSNGPGRDSRGPVAAESVVDLVFDKRTGKLDIEACVEALDAAQREVEHRSLHQIRFPPFRWFAGRYFLPRLREQERQNMREMLAQHPDAPQDPE